MKDETNREAPQAGRHAATVGRPEFLPSLLRAISNTAVSVQYQDVSGNVVWSVNVPAGLPRNPFDGRSVGELTAEGASKLADARQTVLATGQKQRLDLPVHAGGAVRFFDIWIDADQDEETVIGLVTTAVETTDQKRREQTLRALLREVSHRSKNLLAIILSIAGQTGRYSGTIDMFLTRFRGRIQSLAFSQDLVTSSDWRGADLHQLVTSQNGRYCADVEQSVRLTGQNPYLNPNAALHIGLALHELAVNSVSYGALAGANGYVEIDVRLADENERAGLYIVWNENVLPAQPRVPEKRFGSVALERVVPAALDGSALLEIAEGRVSYRLFVPAGNYELDP